MKFFKYLMVSFLLFNFMMAGYESEINNYWQQKANYEMSVNLNPDSNQVVGSSTITYINNSPDELDRIYLNLYHRAFNPKSIKTAGYMNMKNSWRAMTIKNQSKTDWIHEYEITDFKAIMPSGRTVNQYRIDDTVLHSALDGTLSPGDTLVIHVNWVHTVGRMFERSGRVKKQYNMAHWYPRTAVYDQKGWNIDPFHAQGEFYGDFGNFIVTLDLPGNYVVGATGVVVDGDPGWNDVLVDTNRTFEDWLKDHELKMEEDPGSERRVVTFNAENVHDFAWIASPDFLYEGGEWNGIDIHVLYNRENGRKWTKDVLKRSRRVLDWLSTNFGMYPYPQVTTTDRKIGGGMEYPMLVMNGSESESLIAHEIGHIWYYGILANNEVDEAWLDEGFTSFQEDWYMYNHYPTGYSSKPPGNFVEKRRQKAHLDDNEHWHIVRYQVSGHDEPVKRKSYLYNDSGYRINVYNKSARMLKELRHLMGDSLFLAGMQEYFRRWNLKHTNEERFTSSMSDVAGRDLEWFFESWLHDTQVLDYALKNWTTREARDGNWELNLGIEKRGERYFPVEIEVQYHDGPTERFVYEDFLWKFDNTYTVVTERKPRSVVLDPDGKTLDIDFRNNFRSTMPAEFYFNWPGMKYNPRNRYIVAWNPTLAYHEEDGLIPGITLSRSYGIWEKTWLNLGAGTASGNIYGGIRGWRRPVYILRGTTWEYSLYSYSGVRGGSLTMSYTYDTSPSPGLTPVFKGGVYFTNAYDTTLTNLYDPGTVAVLYENVSFTSAIGNTEVDLAVAPAGLSDWSFARLTLTQKFSKKLNRFGIRSRAILGKMWYDDQTGLPGQETYTVEGAGSGTLFEIPYLRDESSMYGWVPGRNSYHLPGDGNLRGFTGDGYSGAYQLGTFNLEGYFSISLLAAQVEFSAFLDGGVIWNDTLDGDFLADAGFGLRIAKEFFSKPFYLRMDLPWLKMSPEKEIEIDPENIVFSFHRSF